MTEKEYQEVINAAHLSRYGTVAREVATALREEAAQWNKYADRRRTLEDLAAKLEAVRTDTIEIVDLKFQGRPPTWAPRLAKALGVVETTPIQTLLERVAAISGENTRAAIERGDEDGQQGAYQDGWAKGREAAYTIVGGLLGMQGPRDSIKVFQAIGVLLRADADAERVRRDLVTKIDVLEAALFNERNKALHIVRGLEDLTDKAQRAPELFDIDGGRRRWA